METSVVAPYASQKVPSSRELNISKRAEMFKNSLFSLELPTLADHVTFSAPTIQCLNNIIVHSTDTWRVKKKTNNNNKLGVEVRTHLARFSSMNQSTTMTTTLHTDIRNVATWTDWKQEKKLIWRQKKNWFSDWHQIIDIKSLISNHWHQIIDIKSLISNPIIECFIQMFALVSIS